MMKKRRITYVILFGALLFIEICIALFVHDRFVRPYIGDALVTVLLCCLCRIAVPQGTPALPVCVFAFAVMVELAQYVDVVALLGWEKNAFLSTVIGRTFSWPDILCYGAGCLSFWAAEKAAAFWRKRHPGS